MCLCPGSALGRRSRTSPDDPYDEHKRQYGTSSHLAGGLLPSSVAGPYWRLYGRGADTETPQVGAGSLGFCLRSHFGSSSWPFRSERGSSSEGRPPLLSIRSALRLRLELVRWSSRPEQRRHATQEVLEQCLECWATELAPTQAEAAVLHLGSKSHPAVQGQGEACLCGLRRPCLQRLAVRGQR